MISERNGLNFLLFLHFVPALHPGRLQLISMWCLIPGISRLCKANDFPVAIVTHHNRCCQQNFFQQHPNQLINRFQKSAFSQKKSSEENRKKRKDVQSCRLWTWLIPTFTLNRFLAHMTSWQQGRRPSWINFKVWKWRVFLCGTKSQQMHDDICEKLECVCMWSVLKTDFLWCKETWTLTQNCSSCSSLVRMMKTKIPAKQLNV